MKTYEYTDLVFRYSSRYVLDMDVIEFIVFKRKFCCQTGRWLWTPNDLKEEMKISTSYRVQIESYPQLTSPRFWGEFVHLPSQTRPENILVNTQRRREHIQIHNGATPWLPQSPMFPSRTPSPSIDKVVHPSGNWWMTGTHSAEISSDDCPKTLWVIRFKTGTRMN